MKTVLILDCETTGLDREKDSVLEVGCILWSVEHRCMLECYSGLLPAQENPAEHVNAIPAAALREVVPNVDDFDDAWLRLLALLRRCDAVAAHQADFDRAFVAAALRGGVVPERVWICTREDMTWPKAGTGESLIATALAHGVAVTSAHRAIHDCLLLARLFEAVPDIGDRLDAAYEHAKLPKARYVALVPYEERERAKDAGFKWDPQRREWWRVLASPDAAALPFKVREVAL